MQIRAVQKELSGWVAEGLEAMITDHDVYYADLLFKAMDGMGCVCMCWHSEVPPPWRRLRRQAGTSPLRLFRLPRAAFAARTRTCSCAS